jgi:hypothetical protein
MPSTMTMADAFAYGGFEDFESGLYKRFTELSPVLEILPWVQIQGNSLTYTIEDSLPTAANRPVNGTYTSSTPAANKVTEELKITGDQGQIDNYLIATQGDQQKAVDLKVALFDSLAQAVSNKIDQDFWEGDTIADINAVDGMRNRISGNQAVNVTTNGGPITIDLLDQVIDLVPFPNRHAFLNRFTRRKINALLRAAGTSIQMSMSPNEVGRQLDMYGDVQFHVVERTGDASSILGFDEQSGSSATTASVYVVALGEELVHGIYAGSMPAGLNVKDFGELQTAPQILGRLETYWGICKKHDRAASRLRGITQA